MMLKDLLDLDELDNQIAAVYSSMLSSLKTNVKFQLYRWKLLATTHDKSMKKELNKIEDFDY